MTTEELLETIQAIKDAWYEVAMSMLEASQALSDLFRDLYEGRETECEQVKMSPKQYGMSLQKRSQRHIPRYHFMRSAPRNRPYQKRVF